ncbi:unnamed protein product, partial [marine sediment metagenome]
MLVGESSISIDPGTSLKVAKAGDTMTGDLIISEAALSVTRSGNINTVATFSQDVQFFGVGLPVVQILSNVQSSLTTTIGLGIYCEGGNNGANAISVTGSPSMLMQLSNASWLMQLRPGGLLFKPLTAVTSTILEIDLAVVTGGGAQFCNWGTSEGEKFVVDSAGNTTIGGAIISPRFGPGLGQNLCLHSEDMTDVVWSKVNVTINGNAGAAPDGALAESDEFSASAANPVLSQSITAITSASKTVTAQGWFKRTNVGGSTLRLTVEDSTASESSADTQIGLFGDENKWQFRTATVAFTGAATGSPVVKIHSVNALTRALMWGVAVSENDGAVAYLPTDGLTHAKAYGLGVNGHLHVASIATPAQIEIT